MIPKGVAAIGWIAVGMSLMAFWRMISSIISSFTTGAELGDIKEVIFWSLFIVGNASLQLAIGIGLLKGKNWARLLLLWLAPIYIIGVAIFTGQFRERQLLSLTLYIVVVIYLTRPHVLNYFGISSNDINKKKG